VKGLQAYDVSRGATFLGQSWLTNSLIKINTDNTVNGWSNWPFSSTEYYWSSWPVKVGLIMGRGEGLLVCVGRGYKMCLGFPSLAGPFHGQRCFDHHHVDL
jgi:hypothetical protein